MVGSGVRKWVKRVDIIVAHEPNGGGLKFNVSNPESSPSD